ncbi:MAG: hypothetical protein ABIG84_08215 [archaeon]
MCYIYTSIDYEVLNLRYQKEKANILDPSAETQMLPRPYKRCVKYGSWDYLNPHAWDPSPFECIKVNVNGQSMAGYRDDGFKPNFCRDNKGKLEDKAGIAIDAGIIMGGIALALFPPTSPAGAAVIIGASGAAGGFGEAVKVWWDINDRWPKDQSD